VNNSWNTQVPLSQIKRLGRLIAFLPAWQSTTKCSNLSGVRKSQSMKIDVTAYPDEGMYIHCQDGTFFDFSLTNIARLSTALWNDPSRLSPEIRHDELFKTCAVCPFRGQDVLCSAIKPLLPFLENVERFKSVDRVIIVYRDPKGIVSTQSADMQTALQYLTDMSVFQYCEDMKGYKEYFVGIRPMRSTQENVQTLLLNVFWRSRGSECEAKRVMGEIQNAIDIITRNCFRRLHLMCRSDAFKNAYVKTHIIGELIALSSDKFIEGQEVLF
jgi:hypothetical protein